MAGKTLMATIPFSCDWGPHILVKHTEDNTNFLVSVFGEDAGNFKVNVFQLILGVCSFCLRKVLGLVSFSF
jgi:type IV secretory pathway VirB4 component